MAHFVLVHGSFHGAWCWRRLVPLLVQRGHEVSVPELPGSGDDPASLDEATLATYTARIVAEIGEQPDPVILVGHSMGAIVYSQVAESIPHRVRALICVCGLLLRSGESLIRFLADHAGLDVEDLVLKYMSVSADGAVAGFPASAAHEVFYNECSPEDSAWAAGRLRPQATAVYGEALQLTPSRFGGVRRFYVEGENDRAVSIRYQRLMVERTPCEKVFSLDSDHCPMLSRPLQLAAILDAVVAVVLPSG